jgi:transcription elongation factor Elf1
VSALPSKGREEALTCPRCKTAMVQIVHVDSLGDQPALEVYECRNCGHFVSQLRERIDELVIAAVHSRARKRTSGHF